MPSLCVTLESFHLSINKSKTFVYERYEYLSHSGAAASLKHETRVRRLNFRLEFRYILFFKVKAEVPEFSATAVRTTMACN